MNRTFTTALIALTAAGPALAQDFTAYNDRAAFLAAVDTVLIDDDLERYAPNDTDFENTSVNTLLPGNPLMGFDVAHVGDEITTQFVNGTMTNGSETGNPGVDIQFLLDLAGVTGAFGSFSNVADMATITVQTAGADAFGFDTFGFNDQGQALLTSPGALGNEMGVMLTVYDTLGNSAMFTVNATDPFFGVVGCVAPIDRIELDAIAMFAPDGTEFVAIDNFVGGIAVEKECIADCDGNGTVNIDDIDCFVAAFLAGC